MNLSKSEWYLALLAVLVSLMVGINIPGFPQGTMKIPAPRP
jgi:hypothetical protein